MEPAAFADHLSGGFLGVDLFFVLSGFLITDLLVDEARTNGRVSLTAFWGRRARRLLPALVAMLVTVTVIVQATADSDLVRSTLADGPWVQANLVNWHLIAESADHWARFGPGRVFLDATVVWGNTYQRSRDGVVDRSSDGVHTCPQGAARFTVWLLAELAKLYPGFTPPKAAEWANAGWAADDHVIGC